jgi:hypothetical protein
MSTKSHWIRSMAWKEWREQRWRLGLGALTLSVISASLVRAQLVTTSEALVIVFGPLGLILSIFMAVGPLPPEKAEGTWHFLTAKPMRHGELMIAKWATGAIGLMTALALAGVAAYFAALSRGAFSLTPVPEYWAGKREAIIFQPDSIGLLVRVVISAASSFLSFYTLLFIVLTRARNELHAGLAGILTTIVVIAWIGQYGAASGEAFDPYPMLKWAAYCFSLANPLCPLMLMLSSSSGNQAMAIVLVPLFWVGLPMTYWMRADRRSRR